jgi:hypothetical protein
LSAMKRLRLACTEMCSGGVGSSLFNDPTDMPWLSRRWEELIHL